MVLRTRSLTVTLRIRLDNLYLDGYRPEIPNQWFEFDNNTNTHLIARSTFLGFNSSYNDLQNAGERRDMTNLGQQPFITASTLGPGQHLIPHRQTAGRGLLDTH